MTAILKRWRRWLFPLTAACIGATFFVIMIVVFFVAHLRQSGHTGLDMGKVYLLRQNPKNTNTQSP